MPMKIAMTIVSDKTISECFFETIIFPFDIKFGAKLGTKFGAESGAEFTDEFLADFGAEFAAEFHAEFGAGSASRIQVRGEPSTSIN